MLFGYFVHFHRPPPHAQPQQLFWAPSVFFKASSQTASSGSQYCNWDLHRDGPHSGWSLWCTELPSMCFPDRGEWLCAWREWEQAGVCRSSPSFSWMAVPGRWSQVRHEVRVVGLCLGHGHPARGVICRSLNHLYSEIFLLPFFPISVPGSQHPSPPNKAQSG